MALDVHSVLLLDKKAVGIRFNLSGVFYDVEIEKLRGIRKEHLVPHKKETLIPVGNLLMTQDEIDGKIKVEDASSNERFCIAASGCATSPPRDAQKTAGAEKMFKVTVEIENLNPISKEMEKQQLTGEFEAKNALVARKLAKEFYAKETGTDIKEIKVTNAVLA